MKPLDGDLAMQSLVLLREDLLVSKLETKLDILLGSMSVWPL